MDPLRGHARGVPASTHPGRPYPLSRRRCSTVSTTRRTGTASRRGACAELFARAGLEVEGRDAAGALLHHAGPYAAPSGRARPLPAAAGAGGGAGAARGRLSPAPRPPAARRPLGLSCRASRPATLSSPGGHERGDHSGSARPTAASTGDHLGWRDLRARSSSSRLGPGRRAVELILARGKPHPEGVPNWTVHRFPIGRGLRWYVAPFVVPAAVKRVRDHGGLRRSAARTHSATSGPGALWARRRYGLDVPVVSHHHHLDRSPLNRLIEARDRGVRAHVITVSEFSRRQLADELGCGGGSCVR